MVYAKKPHQHITRGLVHSVAAFSNCTVVLLFVICVINFLIFIKLVLNLGYFICDKRMLCAIKTLITVVIFRVWLFFKQTLFLPAPINEFNVSKLS